MRKILFRGKRTDNGEWVYGSPIFQDGYVLIRFWNDEEFEYEEYLVAPETVGQYTGLKDKNGKKIFEGDILSDTDNNFVVVFDKYCSFMITNGKDNYLLAQNNDGLIVVGNIHDNPELIRSDNNAESD